MKLRGIQDHPFFPLNSVLQNYKSLYPLGMIENIAQKGNNLFRAFIMIIVVWLRSQGLLSLSSLSSLPSISVFLSFFLACHRRQPLFHPQSNFEFINKISLTQRWKRYLAMLSLMVDYEWNKLLYLHTHPWDKAGEINSYNTRLHSLFVLRWCNVLCIVTSCLSSRFRYRENIFKENIFLMTQWIFFYDPFPLLFIHNFCIHFSGFCTLFSTLV